MTSLPPLPQSSSRSNSVTSPIEDSYLKQLSSNDYGDELAKPSPIPILVSIISVIASGVLIFASKGNSFPMTFVGYLLTPLASTLCLAWDDLWQRKKARDPYFVKNWNYGLVLRILALVGLVLAFEQCWRLARIFGTWFANG
jgi:hypothetical protein